MPHWGFSRTVSPDINDARCSEMRLRSIWGTWSTFPKEIVTAPPWLFGHDLWLFAPHHRQHLPICCLDISPLSLDGVVKEALRTDGMVLVAPVQVSQLSNPSLRESIAAIVALVSNADSYFFFCLPLRHSSPRCPRLPHLDYSPSNVRRCFPNLDFEGAGWDFWFPGVAATPSAFAPTSDPFQLAIDHTGLG